jgi:hypothetical protein
MRQPKAISFNLLGEEISRFFPCGARRPAKLGEPGGLVVRTRRAEHGLLNSTYIAWTQAKGELKHLTAILISQ